MQTSLQAPARRKAQVPDGVNRGRVGGQPKVHTFHRLPGLRYAGATLCSVPSFHVKGWWGETSRSAFGNPGMVKGFRVWATQDPARARPSEPSALLSHPCYQTGFPEAVAFIAYNFKKPTPLGFPELWMFPTSPNLCCRQHLWWGLTVRHKGSLAAVQLRFPAPLLGGIIQKAE